MMGARRRVMKALFLACGIWLAAFTMAVVGLITTSPGNSDRLGQIILDHKPFCQSFVVQTEERFVLLDWEDGNLTFGETDTIKGPLHNRGLHTFEVIGRGLMEARLYEWTSNRLHAEQTFRGRCGLDRGSPVGTALAQ
jgi:hypothetical protein